VTDDGRLLTVDGRPALRFERRYRQPVDRVWHAVTEPSELARWFPSEVVGERSVGAELLFPDDAQRAAAAASGEPARAEGDVPRGQVVVHDPPHVFSFTWGGELLRFELHPDGEGTRLVFTHVLTHRATAHRNGAGWLSCLGELDRLMGLDVEAEGWELAFARCVERLGPDLADVEGSSLIWEGSSHVGPDEVAAALADPAAWGAPDLAEEDLTWDVEPHEHGTTFRLRHAGIDGDAELAARWHALVIQLDMYLAARQLVPVDPTLFRQGYAALLAP